MGAFEKTVSATEFKATCLDLFDQAHDGKLRRINITKRGRPFLTLVPENPRRPSEHLFGALSGMFRIPDGLDLTAPVVNPADVEAMRDWAED